VQHSKKKSKLKNSTTVQHPGTKLSKNKMAAEGTFLRKLGKSVFQIKILRSLRYQGKISTYNFSMKIPQSKATRFKKIL
jgi:hypothetical protein